MGIVRRSLKFFWHNFDSKTYICLCSGDKATQYWITTVYLAPSLSLLPPLIISKKGLSFPSSTKKDNVLDIWFTFRRSFFDVFCETFQHSMNLRYQCIPLSHFLSQVNVQSPPSHGKQKCDNAIWATFSQVLEGPAVLGLACRDFHVSPPGFYTFCIGWGIWDEW